MADPIVNVYLVWFGGGILGIYDNQAAADQVAAARNAYALRVHGARKQVVMARVDRWDVQTTPMPEDITET